MLSQMPAFAETGAIKYSYDRYDVEYSILNEWDNGQSVEVKITNTWDDPILNWALKYDTKGETRVVMEYTGTYYEPIANALRNAGIFVSVVNFLLVDD